MKLGSNDISAVKIGSTDVNKIYIGSTEVWTSFTGLLDTYSGASAAYSLRRLSSTYTGSAIEVRRDSDNATQDIGFVNNELDVTTLETFCSGTDGFVTTWYDQSGNGNDATQTTSANQPKIVSSGSTITENGKPAIRFISSNSTSLQANYSFNYVTTFTLTKFITRPAFAYIYSAYGESRNLMGDRQPEGYRINASNNLFLGQTPSLTNQDLIYALFDSSNSEIAVDGGSVVSGNAGTYSSSGLTIGSAGSPNADAYLNGTMQEAIFYPSDQSSNRTGIETNINNHYNIY